VSPSRIRAKRARIGKALGKIDGTTLVEVQLHTWRTHQIRVHFSAVKHPVVAIRCTECGGRIASGEVTLPAIERNFLSRRKAGFAQPRTGA